MPQSFQTGRRTGSTSPRIQELYYETSPAQTFARGALVVLDTNGLVIECASPTCVLGTAPTAGPTAITGVALNAVKTKPGFDLPNSTLTNVITGQEGRVSVAIADREQEFSARIVDFINSVDPIVPTRAMIGQQYAVVKYNGDWVINYNDQANVAIQVTDIEVPSDTNTSVGLLFVLCKFLPGVVTIP